TGSWLTQWLDTADSAAVSFTRNNDRPGGNMKLAAIAAAAAAASLSITTHVRADTKDVEAIRRLELQFAEAVNAGNVDAIMKVYVPGQSLVVFDVVPPRQYIGADAYRKDWQAFVSMFAGPVKFDISDLVISANGELAYSHS